MNMNSYYPFSVALGCHGEMTSTLRIYCFTRIPPCYSTTTVQTDLVPGSKQTQISINYRMFINCKSRLNSTSRHNSTNDIGHCLCTQSRGKNYFLINCSMETCSVKVFIEEPFPALPVNNCLIILMFFQK